MWSPLCEISLPRVKHKSLNHNLMTFGGIFSMMPKCNVHFLTSTWTKETISFVINIILLLKDRNEVEEKL